MRSIDWPVCVGKDIDQRVLGLEDFLGLDLDVEAWPETPPSS